MRLLANENIPGPLVAALRAAGHEVAWMVEDGPGTADEPILVRASSEARVLLTSDLDFGELVFRQGVPAQSGVILLRLPCESLERFLSLAMTAMQSREDWDGHFSVIELGRIRMTPLPAPSRP
jgi:predicted nuclease of predicted toxin-antitoxin system